MEWFEKLAAMLEERGIEYEESLIKLYESFSNVPATKQRLSQLQTAIEVVEIQLRDFFLKVDLYSKECLYELDDLALLKSTLKKWKIRPEDTVIEQTPFDILSRLYTDIMDSTQDILTQIANCRQAVSDAKVPMDNFRVYSHGVCKWLLLMCGLVFLRFDLVVCIGLAFKMSASILNLVWYPLKYLSSRAKRKLSHLENTLKRFEQESTDILYHLGVLGRLIHCEQALRENATSDSVSALEDKVICTLTDMYLEASNYANSH